MFKKITALFLMGCLLAVNITTAVSAEELKISAKSAALIEADSGRIIYEKNGTEKLPMASTTKIMTALITLEMAQMNNKIVTITDQMARVEGSSMGLKPGYKLTLKDLAIGMLVVSGNDAANSAAIAISGSIEKFAEKMNQRAKELCLNNTHFVTPSGLDSKEHYTTALDLARLSAVALQNPEFASIVKQKQISVKLISPEQTFRLTNHNKLLSMYDGCIGIKTGFTKKAGRCLSSAAERNNVKLVAVTLNAPDDWDDHRKLLDYGFSQLTSCNIDDSNEQFTIPVVGGTADTVTVFGAKSENFLINKQDADSIKRTVELPRFVYAPIESGQIIGAIRYTLNDETIAVVPLTASMNIPIMQTHKNFFQKIWDAITGLFQ